MILFMFIFMWLVLDMHAKIKDLNISTSQKIGKIEDNFQKNAKYITNQPNSLKNINNLAAFLCASIILVCLGRIFARFHDKDSNPKEMEISKEANEMGQGEKTSIQSFSAGKETKQAQPRVQG